MRKWAGRGLVFLGVVVAMLGTIYLARFSVTTKDVETARTRLEQARAALQARASKTPPGNPTSATPNTTTPSEDRLAALKALVEQSKAALTQEDMASIILHVRQGSWTDAEAQKADALLKRFAAELEGLRAFARDANQCPLPQLTSASYLEMSRECSYYYPATLLELSVRAAAHGGNLDLAEQDLSALFHLAAALPALGTNRSECWQIAQRTLVDVLPGDAVTTDRGSRLAAVARETLPDQAEFTNEFVGEVDVFSAIFSDEVLAADPNQDRSVVIAISRPFRTTATADMMAFAEDIVALSDRPYYEIRDQLDAIRAREGRARYTNPMAWKMPTWADFYVHHFAQEARRDLLCLGLAIEAYRNEHGSYPASLEVIAARLGGTLPLDPFTGRPYVYRVSGDTFALYSVGADQTDQGGSRSDDVVWRDKAART